MPIKVLVNGAFGRMGLMTATALSENSKFELVGQTGREYDLKKSILDSGAEVVVDFTRPESVFNNTEIIIQSGARPVIGTSGLMPKQIANLQAECKKLSLGGIIAPNFSLASILMVKCAKEIVRYMPRVEIIEWHHENKADSPSGTALRTAQLLAENREQELSLPPTNETVKGSRGADHDGIAIHAVRLPGLLAHQEIIFGELGETLRIRHDTIDRQSFLPGIFLACEKVMTLHELVYGMENII